MELVDGVTTIGLVIDGVSISIPTLVIGTSTLYAQSKPLDFESGHGESGKVKHISGLRLDIEADQVPQRLFVKLGWQTKLENPIVWTPFKQVEALNELFPFAISGRYISFYIEDNFPTVQWKLTKIQFYGRLMKGRL